MAKDRRARWLVRVAQSDATFQRDGTRWTGKCLICNGWVSFDERDGVGANLEHIRPRSHGGGNELENLAVTHPACNGEKGRRWDTPRRRRRDGERARAIEARLLALRRERLRGIGPERDRPGP